MVSPLRISNTLILIPDLPMDLASITIAVAHAAAMEQTLVKVSITLPNTAQISLEAEEAEIIHGLVGMVLRDLPLELMHQDRFHNGSALQSPELENGINVTNGTHAETLNTAQQVPTNRQGTAEDTKHQTPSSAGDSGSQETAAQTQKPPEPLGSGESSRTQPSPEKGISFAEFCRNANPMGDMRRAVVAAEGASRILGMPSVDAADLAVLFDLARWNHAHNFIQTLRNAARDKFRWLERVPGRAGRYTVTQLGRSVTLGE